ncbi:MAG: thioester reductase domain-containing protein [Acidobacteriota bacterium]|nr:thioester reductase domain-containing protein [Acidobacteriota bacterium]
MTPSILRPFYEWTERNPDKLLFAFLDGEGRTTESYTYAQFLQRTTEIASHIQRTCPMNPGERVLLAYPPGVEMICAFFACVRLGLIPVPVYPPTSHGFQAARDKTEFIARDCQATAVVTGRSYYWSMKLNQTRNRAATLSLKRDYLSTLKWIISTDADKGARADFAEGHSEVLFLQYTSGSTSEPKGVMVSHDNILANCESVVDHLPVGVSWLPQYHDMGLIGYYIFFALKGGTTYGFSPVDFIQRPALWLETISRYRGTASSAPNFAYEYCLRPDKLPAEALERLDLSSLRFLMTAAEPVRATVCRDFLRKFEPYGLNPKSFFSAYGLAEYTLAVSNYGRTIAGFDRAALCRHQVQPANGNAAADTTMLVSCGRTLGTTEVRIVDVTGAPRETGAREVGEIWIRGRSKCLGYWRRPELSAALFEAQLPGDPTDSPTWLRSGDLGFMLDGELYLCGRVKDMIIVRGLNYYPQDIEALVEEDPLVRKGCVAAFACEAESRESLVVVAELKNPRRLPDAGALNRRLLQQLGVAAASFVFIEPRTIPKTSSGKIVRHLARERWLEGRLCVVSQVDSVLEADPPDGSSSESGRPNAWLRRFGLSGAETWTLADAGFDSLKLVEFSQAIKEQLESHGDHDLSGAVDLRVLQKIAICELVDLLEQVAAAAPHARLRLRRALSDLGREHRALEAAMMRRDTRLRFDVATLPKPTDAIPAPEGAVLLTGGTGFFGPFLLASLLQQSTDDIYVLVRANDSEAMRRLHEGLASVASDGTSCPDGWERRVRPICGDLSAANLGLSDATWGTLADHVHTIYHNGASVNYLLDYQAMRDANVGGTNEIVRLAMSHRAKVLNHISTTFVFGWSVKETLFEGDTNAGMDHLDFGYSQSKWASEQVVRDAMQQGLQARIFRPALLTPSVHGGGYNCDISIRLLTFMINHGIGTTARNQVSFSPADLAADNIVAISRVPGSVGATYHVTRDDYASMSDITKILGELTGSTFRNYPLDAFVPEVIERCHSGDILFPLLDFLVRSVDNITAMEFKRYDNSHYRQVRDASAFGKADPPLHDVVLGILRFMRKQHLVKV